MQMITPETTTRGAYTGRSPIASGLTKALTMPDVTSIVFVVDDDVSVRDSLELLIKSRGWRSVTFASAHEFLAHPPATVPCCLVLDVALPGLNGLDLQRQLPAPPDMPIFLHPGPRGPPRHADYLHPGPRRHSHDRASHEGRSHRISHEAIETRGRVGGGRERHRAESGRLPSCRGDAGAAHLVRLPDRART